MLSRRPPSLPALLARSAALAAGLCAIGAAIPTARAASLTWTGTGASSVWDIGASANWNGNTSSYHEGDSVTFDNGGVAANVVLNALVHPAAVTFSNTSLAYTLTGTGGFAGAFPLSQPGSGSTAIATSDGQFTGTVAISAGTLELDTPAAVGGAAITLTGGTLSLRSDVAADFASAVSVNAAATIHVDHLTANPDVTQFLGSLNVGSAATLTLDQANSANLEVQNLSGSGPVLFHPLASLFVAGTYSYTGTLVWGSATNGAPAADMDEGLQFLGNATFANNISDNAAPGGATGGSPRVGVSGATVTFNGYWLGDSNTTANYIFVRNGGHFIVGGPATLDTVSDSTGHAGQLAIYGDGNAGNIFELAGAFRADQSFGPFLTVFGSCQLESGTITLLTHNTISLPVYSRSINGNGATGQILFGGGGNYTWQVATAAQTYDATVQLNSSATIQTDFPLTLSGAAAAFTDGIAHNGLLLAAANVTLTKTGSAALNLTGDQAYEPGAILQVNNGMVNMTTDPGNPAVQNAAGDLNGQNLTVNVAGAGSAAHFGALTTTLAALNVSEGGAAFVGNVAGGPTNPKTLVTQALTITGTGSQLDLGGNSMVVQSASPTTALPALVALVQAGRDNGLWDGPGLTSSAAAGNVTALGYELTGLAVVLNSTLPAPFTTFSADNIPVKPADILIKYTYVGDANLDGVVNLRDYQLLDYSYLHGGVGLSGATGWVAGDFNYDGVVNYLDYALIDHAFAFDGGPLAEEMVALHAAEFGAAYSAAFDGQAVPEPAAGLLSLIGAPLLLRRRRAGRAAR